MEVVSTTTNFEFKFKFLDGTASFTVPATSTEEAAEKLKGQFHSFLASLEVKFPTKKK